MTRAPDDLTAITRRLGARADYVQGGGGNTSIKIDGAHMWIKASGIELATATAETGFVGVDYPAIRQGLAACKTEADYTALVRHSATGNFSDGRRPSIEAGFHALLGPAVLHSHSVWANIIGCAAEAHALLKRILPDALFVPYATPGLDLTQLIEARLFGRQNTGIVLLQNHGIIASAATLDAAWDEHERAAQAIRAHFGLTENYVAADGGDADAQHVLFPDQAVYLEHAALRYSKAGVETLQAYGFVRRTLERLGLEPNYLPESEVRKLLDMEAEKYRQKVAGA